jgi:hypothetical protein
MGFHKFGAIIRRFGQRGSIVFSAEPDAVKAAWWFGLGWSGRSWLAVLRLGATVRQWTCNPSGGKCITLLGKCVDY